MTSATSTAKGLLGLLCMAALAACASASQGDGPSAGSEVVVLDGAAAEVLPDASPLPDLALDDPDAHTALLAWPACPPEGRQPGCPCIDAADCASGLCVPSPDGRVCTDICFDGCPADWTCTALTGSGVTFLCLPDLTYLCRPCETDADCGSGAPRPGACVSLTAVAGSFCAIGCGEPASCPVGFSCSESADTGQLLCVPDSGECTCNPLAVAEAASTTCEATRDDWACPGHRVCASSGLSPCDAPPPSAEVCDGSDNDCDGSTDVACVGMECIDICAPPGPCIDDGANCDDGDPCTQGDTCAAGKCVGVLAPCPACSTCDGVGGCTAPLGGCLIAGACPMAGEVSATSTCLACIPDVSAISWTPIVAAPCDDGDPCTLADHCMAGVCSGSPAPCLPCQACDGEGGCLLEPEWCVIDNTCVADSSVASCATCDPAVSTSAWTPLTGAACDDGNPCTVGDACGAGACVGLAVDCSSASSACTTGACVGGGCVSVPTSGACDDGDVCTDGDACAAGACTALATIPCDDDNACTSDGCDPVLGCIYAPTSTPCEDGDPCTSTDTCVQGTCTAGPAADCDDGNPCTDDWCDTVAGCQHVGECCGTLGVQCPDGFECTAKGTCENADEVFVPAGPFWMGCDLGATSAYYCFADARPAHEVVLSPFAIDRTEVTVADYQACVLAGVCSLPEGEAPTAGANYGAFGKEQHPVNYVTRDMAVAFCTWVGRRLPTEAEWEKAAIGGCETVEGDCKLERRDFPWGHEPATCELAVVSENVSGCGTYGTAMVGSKAPGASPYGALDMAGNVGEWVNDAYKSDYYCNGPEAACDDFCFECATKSAYQSPWFDPPGPVQGTRGVSRGGAFDSLPGNAVAASQRSRRPLIDAPFLYELGFRCAKSTP